MRFVEPGEGSDREAGLRLLAAEGMDLVIGVGFIFTDDLTQLAKEYPNVSFAGVDFAVVVQPEPYQDDHRYLEHCLAVGKGRLKGTLLVFADRPGSLEQLPDLAKRLAVVTARVHAYLPDRLPPFGLPELRRLWRLAGEHDLAVQLHFTLAHAAGFEPLLREFKDTRVIVDHLGRPFGAPADDYDRVVRWSALPNVVMKLSSLPAPDASEAVSLPRVVKRLAEAFGQARSDDAADDVDGAAGRKGHDEAHGARRRPRAVGGVQPRRGEQQQAGSERGDVRARQSHGRFLRKPAIYTESR